MIQHVALCTQPIFRVLPRTLCLTFASLWSPLSLPFPSRYFQQQQLTALTVGIWDPFFSRILPFPDSLFVRNFRLFRYLLLYFFHAVLRNKSWDVCAAEAVMKASGGGFSDIEGNQLAYPMEYDR